MNRSRNRTFVAIALLSIAAVSGTAAASASATGTTAYTCTAGSGAGFSDAHCVKAVGSGATFVHVPITQATDVEITNAGTANGTTESTPATFKAQIMGVELSVACTTVGGKGKMENGTSGAEMIFSGTAVLVFSGCTVEQLPDCTVSGGSVTTNSLTFTTAGQGMGAKVAPTTGTVLANVTIDGCNLNVTLPLTGSLVLTPNGATLNTTHNEITLQNTLKFAGQKAGLSLSLTSIGPSGAGLAFTT
jgi:hypothetical protein